MAEIIASTIAVLLEKAVSVTANRIGLVLGFYKDLEDLQVYDAKVIQAVLADAETKQSQNPTVLLWLQKVEEAAREASYVLDEIMYESLRQQVKSRNKSMGAKVCLFFSLSKHDISFRWRMSSKVRGINDKLKRFNMEATTSVGLTRVVDAVVAATVVAATPVNLAKSRQTDSLALTFVAGRASEISDIVERVMSCSSNGLISVLPITGMGGLGKTIVAKSVYNNEIINGHFSKKSWFCVSERFFDVVEAFRGILESLKGVKVEPCGRDALVQQIQKELNRERFLVVLDDVWNVDKLLWDDFYNSLAAINTANGSFCVVTTRLQATANLVYTVAPFELGKLLDDDCWSILTQRAARGGNIPDEMNVLKSQILRRCQGLPLAENAIGGMLSLQSREKWISVVEKQLLKVNEVVGEITPILKLSFENLPSPSIKKCFAYCSIYEKDKKIDGRELVEFWMAEGFLHDETEKRKTMEDVGRNHIMILLQSSLLEEIENWRGCYQMHDLVHDLAESISKPRLLGSENNYLVQHLELVNEYMDNHWNARSPLIKIVKGYPYVELLSKFRYLHVLNLVGATQNLDDAELENLGCSISKLKHLRSLTINFMTRSLCKLYNLQTLRLFWHPKKCLPHELSNLIRLRHIILYYTSEMAPHMGRLTCLQTLNHFNVGKEEGCGIEELGFLKNLEGRLDINNLELVKGSEAAMSDLRGKKKLENLELSWNIPSHQGCVIDGDVERVLEGLEPHPNLRRLSIDGSMGDIFPSWWGNLSALVSLELNRCYECTKLPAMGRFPYLESLLIWDLNNVVSIGDSYYNVENCRIFPSLKYLDLHNMRNLTEWKELQVEVVNGFDHCGQSGMSPTFHFPSLDRLELSGYIKASVVKDIIGKSVGSLRQLKLRSLSGMSSVSDVMSNHLNLNSLERFTIEDCEELTDLDIQSSTSLKSLGAFNCPKLLSCPQNFQHTPFLERLWFNKCPNMFTTEAMPRGFAHLTNLRGLSFGPFTDDSAHLFDWSGLLGLSTLKSLNLAGFSDQRSNLPQQLQRFTSLEELYFRNFASVESLPDWFGSLTSLQKLGLEKFPQLQYLPSATAMASLTNLQTLEVLICPLLSQSWDNKSNDPSSEWSKISCLPNLRVLI